MIVRPKIRIHSVISSFYTARIKAKSTNFGMIDDFDYNCWIYLTSDTTLARVKIV